MFDERDETGGSTFAADEDGPIDAVDEDGPIDAVDDAADFEDAYDEDEEEPRYGEGDAVLDDEPVGDGRAGSPQDSLRHLVHFLATNLVDDPAGVTVEAEQRGQTVGITLRVPEEELGKVIGRQGRIARAIRTVLTIAGSRQNVRASLDIEG